MALLVTSETLAPLVGAWGAGVAARATEGRLTLPVPEQPNALAQQVTALQHVTALSHCVARPLCWLKLLCSWGRPEMVQLSLDLLSQHITLAKLLAVR